MRFVLATFNRDKARELEALLAGAGITLRTLADFPDASAPSEDGGTLLENARIKAQAALAVTGMPAIADDTGLEVEALGGEPGVRSARYAGEGAGDIANNRKLVAEAHAAGLVRPAAVFRCVLSVATPDGFILARGEGRCEGVLIEEPRGRGGCGYDPHFLVPELDRTFAELLPSEKNAMSHRARAIADLKRAIAPLVG